MPRINRTVALLALSVTAACASGGNSADKPSDAGNAGDSELVCVPGTTKACAGTSACQGHRYCQADGTWSLCDCGADGGAGFPGSGGSSGAAGAATGGTGGTPPTTLDLHDATIFNNPLDVADWPETTTITVLDFQQNGQDGVHVEFSKQDGPGRWPDETLPGYEGLPFQYTMGMAEFINGHWCASAAIQFWYGLPAEGGNLALDNQVANNWYYDSRWGEMEDYQPKTGETIGIFVVAGNLRGVLDGSESPVKERSNVVLVPMPDVTGAHHTF